MYKVLVIDSEPMIRKGFKNIIDWSFMGCKLIGEASDENEGLHALKREKLDIVIMDINLPNSNGEEMIKIIKSFSPNCKIIILTAHKNFDCISKVIKLGAFDFILKPSNINEINNVIKKAVKELGIEKEKEKEKEIRNLKLIFEKTKPKLVEKVIYDIINHINTDKEDIFENINMLDIEIKKFVFLLVEIEESEISKSDKYESHFYQYGIINSFEEVLSETFNIIKVSINEKLCGFVVQDTKNKDYFAVDVCKSCKYIIEMIRGFFDHKVMAYISNEGRGLLKLSEKYNICKDMIDYKYCVRDEYVISFNEINLNDNTVFDYKSLKKDHNTIIEAVKVSNTELIRDGIEKYLNRFYNIKSFKESIIVDNCFNLIESLNDIEKMFLDSDDINNSNAFQEKVKAHIKNNSNDFNEIKNIIIKYAIGITGKVNYFNNKKITLAMRNIIEYINENYSKQITLDKVAKQVYFSSYYVSRLFKKVLGKNFIDYLNEIRVEKAKELLKDVKYKAYEVADMVGIQNAHYFSKIFKKYTGMSPTEYREKV